MRNENVRKVDEYLSQWAEWMRSNNENLGFPRNTAEYRIEVFGKYGAAIRKGASNAPISEMPDVVERMEAAILDLPSQEYVDIIKVKYLCNGTDQDRAHSLAIAWSKPLTFKTYRNMLDRAMHWLGGYLNLIEKKL